MKIAAKSSKKNRIERLAIEWRDNKRVKDYLLGGKQLNEAKAFHKEEAANFRLSDLACNFIQKSIRHRRNNNFKLISFGFIPLIALAVYLGFVIEKNIRITRLWDDVEAAQGKEESPARFLALEELVKAGVSLHGIPLQKANLSDANLRGANLKNADFSNANLSSADLFYANLSSADLFYANLSSANLSSANLTSAYLSADLSSANLTSADLSSANLTLAYLNDAYLNDANLRGANLRGANLRGANLRGADLSMTDLWDANLSGAKLGCMSIDSKLYCTNFQDIEYLDLTPQQVKAAKNWNQACYDPEFRKKLGLSPENPKACENWYTPYWDTPYWNNP